MPARRSTPWTLILCATILFVGLDLHAKQPVDLTYGQQFSGTIGQTRVSMHLRRPFGSCCFFRPASPYARIEGFYSPEQVEQDILLAGDVDEQQNWTFSEYAHPGIAPTGHFKGRLDGDTLSGTWQSHDGTTVVPFRLVADNGKPSKTFAEQDLVSHRNQELAADSVKAGDLATAIYYLKMARIAGNAGQTENWEDVFQAVLRGKKVLEALREKLAACEVVYSCGYTLGPLAYLDEREGNFAAAKKVQRDLCVKYDVSLGVPRVFTCLMYAEAAERNGDKLAMLEAYDLACGEQPCPQTRGPNEEDLIAAIKSKNQEMVEKSLAKPDINVNAHNGQALMWAVVWGDLKTVQSLIHKGADPDLSNGYIVDSAIENNHEDVALYLLDHGADPNMDGALHTASVRGNVRIVKALLEKGADVNANDYVGAGTPLILACERNHLEVVKLLLSYGADPTIEAKFHASCLDSTSNRAIKVLVRQAIARCQRDGTCAKNN